MSLTVTRMISLLRKGLGGITATELPDADAEELLNMSLWELEDKYPFETKETVFTSTLKVNKFEYNLGGISRLDALVSISWVDTNGQSHKLDRMTRARYDEIFEDGTGSDPVGPPVQFLREGNVLTVWPPPSDEEDGKTLNIALKESVESLSGGADTTGLPRNWDELVLMGAISRGHFYSLDYSQARESRNFQVGVIRSTVSTEAKEEEDSRYAGLEVAWDRPSSPGSIDSDSDSVPRR